MQEELERFGTSLFRLMSIGENLSLRRDGVDDILPVLAIAGTVVPCSINRDIHVVPRTCPASLAPHFVRPTGDLRVGDIRVAEQVFYSGFRLGREMLFGDQADHLMAGSPPRQRNRWRV